MSQKGVLLVLGTALISGFSIFLNKFGVSGFEPAVFTFMKNMFVGLILLGFILMLDLDKLKELTKKQWGKLALIGLVGGAVPFLLFFQGLSMGSAASSAFIHKTMFIWIAIISFFFLKEKLSKKFLGAAVLLLAGNLLLLRLTGLDIGISSALVFAATLLWSVEIVLSKSVLNTGLPGRMVAGGRMFFGGLFLLAYNIYTGSVSSILAYSADQFMWVAITSVLLFGYVFTFYSGLKLISPVTASVILLLGSPITTLLNVVFADAAITPVQVIGLALIGFGVLLSLLTAGYLKSIVEYFTPSQQRMSDE